MRNFKRKLTIIVSGKNSLFKVMARRRRYDLLNKANNIFDRCYTVKELNYLLN